MPSDLLAGDGGFSQSESMESSVKGCEILYYSKIQACKDCLAWVPSNSHFGNWRRSGCHESTDNIPGRDVIRGLPYGAFIVRGVETHRHGC